MRLIDARADHLARLEVVGDEDVALEPEARRVRRDAVAQVAGRRAAEHREAELHGARGGDRHDAILVGQRRVIHAVVLDVELADAQRFREAIGLDERREARGEAGARLAGDRQQLAIAPQVARPRRDGLAVMSCRDRRSRRRLERSEALVADEQRLGRERRVAHVALQSNYVGLSM